jgi:hypothetical protein
MSPSKGPEDPVDASPIGPDAGTEADAAGAVRYVETFNPRTEATITHQ